eukprot:TRINITY_DN9679_c0_g1_i2.p3 TRINITY_DN9679_c0_g1~~TRINITY_DN9679_c0_g1_i2.p3  ORF type:complete len:103 (+),score=26.29 TRINITY_DN9679_c0_g1_i2:127-435(+)
MCIRDRYMGDKFDLKKLANYMKNKTQHHQNLQLYSDETLEDDDYYYEDGFNDIMSIDDNKHNMQNSTTMNNDYDDFREYQAYAYFQEQFDSDDDDYADVDDK